jgi:Transposase IS66 family
MPTAIGTVLASARGAERVMPRLHHSVRAIAASTATASPATISRYFGVTPRMSGTIIADMVKQTCLATRKQHVLRFLIVPRVPFTNNEAERDGCMMKVKRKISGGFRSLEGATNFAIIRSAIGTALKQGWNVIQVLSQDFKDPRRQVASRLTGSGAKPHGAMAGAECGGTTKPGQSDESLHWESS